MDDDHRDHGAAFGMFMQIDLVQQRSDDLPTLARLAIGERLTVTGLLHEQAIEPNVHLSPSCLARGPGVSLMVVCWLRFPVRNASATSIGDL
jgi:hypothetical protein